MPIYEYRCRACDKDFEKYVSGATTKVACPACASGDITRKLSVFGLKSDGGFVASSMPGGGGCCGGGGGRGPLPLPAGFLPLRGILYGRPLPRALPRVAAGFS